VPNLIGNALQLYDASAQGTAPVFYPGTADSGSAAEIEIVPGASVRGANFTVFPVQSLHVREPGLDPPQDRLVPAGERVREPEQPEQRDDGDRGQKKDLLPEVETLLHRPLATPWTLHGRAIPAGIAD
jgi:hypothetical protein